MHRRVVTALALLPILAATTPAQQPTPTPDLLITNAILHDGTGAPPRRADIAISDGRIAAVGTPTLPPTTAAENTLDADGFAVAPGFIDVHAHADTAILRHPEAANFVRMGVTTIVTGNCGGSVRDIAAHFARLDKGGVGLNYASLIGHGTVRRAVMGTAERAPTTEELTAMVARVEDAMTAGAMGLSTGLIYVPGTYAETDELIALSRPVARHGGVYASHMRNENSEVLAAIDEALRIGREAGVAVHLSHIKSSGKPNWGQSEAILARLTRARAAGVRVTADQYAYSASSTSLDVLFPSSELAVGREAFVQRLRDDDAYRADMMDELHALMERVGFGDLSYCRIAHAPNNPDLAGITIDRAAERRFGRTDPESQARLAIDIMIAAGGKRVGMIYHTMSEDDVEAFMAQPFIAVAADSGIRTGTGKPHPRGSGNNPRVLARYVRDKNVLDLPTAIHKMTALPASVFGLEDRGVVREGAWADLVLFDPDTVTDRATFSEPERPPAGIPHVFVNGVAVVRDGELTGERPGAVLRHRGENR